MRVFKLRILNGEKQVWMFPLTKLVRTVGGGFRSEKVVQTEWPGLVICRKS